LSTFAPPPAEKPKRVRILAFEDYFDPRTLSEFERLSGYQVAYDAYDAPDAIAAKLREGPYDLLILPGPALPQQIATGALQRFDKSRAPNASRITPALTAKLAVYDRSGTYAAAYDWFADGLIFDADQVTALLGSPPSSWAALFGPAQARKLLDCGIVAPDARDDLFVAAWRYLGVDPGKATPTDIKRAADLIARTKAGFRVFGAPDPTGALANGSSCLSMGNQNAARLASERAKAAGQPRDIRFALPKEGGPMSLDVLAIPVDAPEILEAYALADFLLRPDIAARNAEVAGVVSSEAGGDDDMLKRLWPSGALSAPLAAIIDKEWTRLRADK
jgi:putrescine transport system substrate-binding protein